MAEPETRLKQSSSNSFRPPSSDGLAKPSPKSLRPRSGQGPGRPKGQDGVTLERFADPDVVRHVPAVCGGCGDGLADADEVDMTWRQVVDVPPVTPQVTEHQMITLRCRCGHHTTALFNGVRIHAPHHTEVADVREPDAADGDAVVDGTGLTLVAVVPAKREHAVGRVGSAQPRARAG